MHITGYGRWRVHTVMNGEKLDLGNDYSRDLGLEAFAHRYVVAQDPTPGLASAPSAVQQAVRRGRVRVGMTRAQVAMSLGYPVSSETQSLDDALWKYWVTDEAEYHVVFDAGGKLSDVRSLDPALRARMLVP